MRIGPGCEKCLFEKQKKVALAIKDETKRTQYLAEIKEILDTRSEEDTSPYMVSLFRKVQEKYMGKQSFPKEIKNEYNDLVMSLEETIENKIESDVDPLATSFIYARIGNYIDFGAMHQVEKNVLVKMLEEGDGNLDREVYESFCRECKNGKKFVLLCDNCGEIVLDKLFVKQLKKKYPQLQVFAVVRGQEALNDATVEDAVYCGMNQVAHVVPNGNGITGTEWKLLSDEARQVIEQADVILAKGQGNYESLWGFHGPVYYSFLCKCELFTSKFQVPALTGMFVRETR